MAKFRITSPEGEAFEVTAPEGASESEVMAYAQANMPKSRKTPKQMQDEAAKTSYEKNTSGVGDASLSLLTGATTGLLGRAGGALGGIAGSIATGKFGTQEGANLAAQSSEEGAQSLTYSPRSKAGQDTLATVGDLLGRSKLAGLGPSEAIALSGLRTGPAITAAQQTVARPVNALRDMVRPPERQMVGVGAAQTEQAAMRQQRAANLPVPIKLTKGQAERTFEQQQFEREAAKNPAVGKPLQERFAEQNQKILQNFDAWVDQTGAEAGSLRATGEAVDKAIVSKATAAKARINAAYTKAREAGDMAAPVNAKPLRDYLAERRPEAVNAGVIRAADMKLQALSKKGRIDINDLEEVRKMVGNLGGKDATNAHFAKEIKEQIDALTEGAGGAAYKEARSLRTQYAKEFENVGVVDKLLSKKPGTTDRSVAYEDVFDHTIMRGSLDDLRAVRKTLQTAGEGGKQAWKELQGATINHLKEEITKNIATDISGNTVVSPARLNTLVRALDKDGKLDILFGKQGAQQIRDMRDLAVDVYTSPPGSVNTSQTASILMRSLNAVAGGTKGIPGVGWAAGKLAQGAENRALSKRVQGALNPEGSMSLNDLGRIGASRPNLIPMSDIGRSREAP